MAEYGPDVSEEELGIAMTGGSIEQVASSDAAPPPEPRPASDPDAMPSMAARLDLYQRAAESSQRSSPLCSPSSSEGFRRPLHHVGKNLTDTSKAIFNGTGLNWFFPWVRGQERFIAASTSSRR